MALKLFGKLFWYLFGIVVIAVGTMYALNQTSDASDGNFESATVARGTVRVISNVSGNVDAPEHATLHFPTQGVIQEVLKTEGDVVMKGDIIASLVQDVLLAEYNSTQNTLRYEEARKRELVRGPNTEARAVTETNTFIAYENLKRVEEEQSKLVANARQIMLSGGLVAKPSNMNNNDTPPTISGTYTCTDEGTYTLEVFPSGAGSGASYRLSGLGESGTYTAYSETSAPLGACGLTIQFDRDEEYRRDIWTVAIPNTESSEYLANYNAYTLALQTQANALSAARDAITLAEKTAVSNNAPATREEIAQSDALIEATRAKLSAIEAQIRDYVIKAPFDGTISQNELTVGEIAGASQYVTIIREGAYNLVARIPEVDIRTISIGDTATIMFDAAPEERIPGVITFISPSSVQIDGVAYYEAFVRLSYEPEWIREGLNADIDIVTEEKNATLVLPMRFVSAESGTYFVHIRDGEKVYKKELAPGIVGNDGFIEVTNIPEGTTVVLEP